MLRLFFYCIIVTFFHLACADDTLNDDLLAGTQWRPVPPIWPSATLYYSFDSTGRSGTYAFIRDTCFLLRNVTVLNGKFAIDDRQYAFRLSTDPVATLNVTYPVYYYANPDSITGYQDIVFEPTQLTLDSLHICE